MVGQDPFSEGADREVVVCTVPHLAENHHETSDFQAFSYRDSNISHHFGRETSLLTRSRPPALDQLQYLAPMAKNKTAEPLRPVFQAALPCQKALPGV